MSIGNLKLDDLPIVHAAFIYTDDDETEPISLQDTDCIKIAKKLEKQEGKSISQLAKEMRHKPLRTKKTLEIGDNIYELYTLHASSEDKAVFLIEGDTLFTNTLKLKEEKENSLLILPFLDAALLKFLGRSQIYGSNIVKNTTKKKRSVHKSSSSRSMHKYTSKETFSLEEVFRDLDLDGNGSIDIEEWKIGLNSMMSDNNIISDSDIELVFDTISGNNNEIKWRNFYGFFDGKKLTRSTSRRHKMQLSAQLNLPNFAQTKTNLGTLNEEQQNDDITLKDIVINDEKDNQNDENNNDTKHIQKVKQIIRDILNLGEDSYLLSTTPYTPGSSTDLHSLPSTHHVSTNSSLSITGVDIEQVNVSKSLLKIEDCEDLIDLMEHNLYQCPDQLTMTKWENRHHTHKLRINNFRKILNGMLSTKIISMRDENNTLLKQLEKIRDNNGNNNQNTSTNSLKEMADLHNQQLSSLAVGKTKKSKKGKHGRSTSNIRSKRSYSNLSDDDSSSVDSEVNLVYTKGTKLNSKESETLINRVKLQKKQIKKLGKEKKQLKDSHKDEVRKLKRVIEQQGQKITSYEKIRSQLISEKQNIQTQMRKLQGKGKKAHALKSKRDMSAASQREISVLKKQIKNLTNELEAEQERKRNLQRKLTRVISSNNASKDGNANSTVSQNKLRRIEKERNRLEQECLAKTKKMDEMFLKLGSKERKYAQVSEENAELQAKLGSFTTQMKEINKRTMELQSITDDRDRALQDIEILHKKMTKLNEKIAKLKSRNRKMKDRIKNLLITIEEYDKLARHSRNLINDLSSLQRELNAVEIESAKYKNENETLNDKILELRNKIRNKKSELDNTTVKLEKFQSDLSAEYSIIRSLQEQIEEKENAVNELNVKFESEQNKNLSKTELLENEKEELSMELIRSAAQIEQSQKIIDRYKSKCEKYEIKIEELNEKLMNYEQNEIIKLKSGFNDLKNKIDTKNDEIKLLKEKNNKLIEEFVNINVDEKEEKDSIEETQELIRLRTDVEWKKIIVCWNQNVITKNTSHAMLAGPPFWYSGAKHLFQTLDDNFVY
eukprot:458480_1